METELQYIENYFEDRLPLNEKEAFNARIQEDRGFAETVAFYLQTKQLGAAARKKQFVDQHHSLSSETPVIKKVFWGGAIAAAASVAFILITYSGEPRFSVKQDASRYIESNFSVLESQMSVIPNQGITAYNAGSYEEALLIFEKDSTNLLREEYKGLCFYQLQRYDEALRAFQNLAANREILYNKGRFLQALVYIKKEQKDKAKDILTEIIGSTDHAYGTKQAQEILAEL